MTEKSCTKCKATKPLSEFFRDQKCKDGHSAHCAECDKSLRRQYYQRNKVAANESAAIYYEAHKAEIQAYNKEYRDKNRAKLAEQKREYYQVNKVRLNEAMTEYAAVNAEKIAQYQKTYRKDNQEKIAVQAKARTAMRPEYVRRKDAKRRKELYRELRRVILLELGGACYCCGLADLRFLTVDHINNDGKDHRKLSNGTTKNGYFLLLEIQKEGVPKDRYQAACYNCNCARNLTPSKTCPHQLDHA